MQAISQRAIECNCDLVIIFLLLCLSVPVSGDMAEAEPWSSFDLVFIVS